MMKSNTEWNLGKCPRCLNEWSGSGLEDIEKDSGEFVFECQSCNVHLLTDKHRNPLLLNWQIHSELRDTSYLQWNFQSSDCKFKKGNVLKLITTDLPWLPLNIPLDKLKLFLVFS